VKYALLIYGDESIQPAQGTPEFDEMYQAYYKFTEDITNEEVNRGGEALHDVGTATSVRVRDGQQTVTDGPFAETKEQLGGYYLLDCKDLDEAIEYAAKIPSSRIGSVEIRPVMLFD
jgi:hypothetical protein